MILATKLPALQLSWTFKSRLRGNVLSYCHFVVVGLGLGPSLVEVEFRGPTPNRISSRDNGSLSLTALLLPTTSAKNEAATL